MSSFHLGLLVGGFLGALIMFVALGIFHLYSTERQENRARAAAFLPNWDVPVTHRAPPSPGPWSYHHLPSHVREEIHLNWSAATHVYPLFIIIE
jgi:hypothetical protein